MGEGRVRQRVAIVGAVALGVTAAIALVPALRFAYVSPTTRVAMEASQAVIAGMVAVLVHGRVRRLGARSDQLLVLALGIAAAGNLFTVVLRAAGEERDTLSRFGSWASLSLTLLSAVAYALAAHLPERSLPAPQRAPSRPIGAVVLVTAAVLVLMLPLSEVLPRSVTGDFPAGDSSRPSLDLGPAGLGAHLVIFVLLVVACAGFARRAGGEDDPLLSAVAVGLVLAAIARLNFLLYPSVHTTVVHTGDVARLLFYLVLLGGAVAEVSSYWRDRAQLSVLDERQRIARELHDGLLQELSFIRSQVSAFERVEPTPTTIGFVSEAAARALAESRQAVEALSDDRPDALDRIIRQTVSDVADRAGLATRFDLAPGVHLDAARSREVQRVVREATTNVVRHARASILTVSLRPRDGRLRVVVADDGDGFDVDAATHGFGLRSMRERAAAIGGRLSLEAVSGGGTRVVLEVPIGDRSGREPEVRRDHVDQTGNTA